MSKKMNVMLAFAAGLTVGGYGVYNYMTKQLNDIVLDELKNQKEYYEEMLKELGVEVHGEVESVSIEEFEAGDLSKPKFGIDMSKETDYVPDIKGPGADMKVVKHDDPDYVNYENVVRSYLTDDKKPTLKELSVDYPALYEISEEDYQVNENPDKTSVLMYYEEDEVLTDYDDEPIVDQEKLIGDIDLEFGDYDSIFIRNEEADRIFKIMKVEGSYTEIVRGIKE